MREPVLTTRLACRHGNQGELNRASKSQLDAEFGTSKDVDVLQQILEHGNVIETQSSEAKGHRNVANAAGVSGGSASLRE